MDISKIVFGEKHTIEMPADEVTPQGISEITALLAQHGTSDMRHYIQRDSFWPEVWSWRWTQPHGAYVGNLPKRIQSLCYKVYRVQLPAEVVSEIGNIAQRNTNKHTTWVYDFDRDLAWNAGDYGDQGSCFWTEKPWSLPLLKAMGGFAIRVYDPADSDIGLGRGLILPYDPVLEKGRDPLAALIVNGKLDADTVPPPDGGPPTLVVFNGYGQFRKDYVNDRGKRYGHMQSMDYARILAQILGQSYHKTTFLVNGSHIDPIFVNNEGTSSFLVGPDPLIRKLLRINVTVSAALVSLHKSTCPDCGRAININPERRNPRFRDGIMAPDGTYFCSECWSNHYLKCYGCTSIVNNDTQHRVLSVDGATFGVCDGHRSRVAKVCSQCESLWVKDEMQRISGKRDLCPSCWRDFTRSCHQCKHRFLRTELTACIMPDDLTTRGRPVGVCKRCLEQARKVAAKRLTVPKYEPVAEPLHLTMTKARFGHTRSNQILSFDSAVGAALETALQRIPRMEIVNETTENRVRLAEFNERLLIDGLTPFFDPDHDDDWDFDAAILNARSRMSLDNFIEAFVRHQSTRLTTNDINFLYRTHVRPGLA